MTWFCSGSEAIKVARPVAVTSKMHPPAYEHARPAEDPVIANGLSNVAVEAEKCVSGVSAIAANALLLAVFSNQSFGASAAATVGTPLAKVAVTDVASLTTTDVA